MNETVTDRGPQPDDRALAELCALADGTLPVERRAAVEARVAASPRLTALLERQRRSLAATGMVADEPVPASLCAAVDTVVAAARTTARPTSRSHCWQGRSLALRLSAIGALAAVVAIALLLTLSGGPAGPSVADAARLAVLPPVGSPPAALGASQTQLAADVQGLAFPDFSRSFGWQASGIRHGRVGGRSATIVYYASGGRQVAYAIVAGTPLTEPSDATTSVVSGVQFQTVSLEGRSAVTWRRGGHTCVLIGDASRAELLALASWRAGGTVGY